MRAAPTRTPGRVGDPTRRRARGASRGARRCSLARRATTADGASRPDANADLVRETLETTLAFRASLFEAGDLWSTSGRASLLGGGAESGAEPRFTLSYMPMRNRAEVPRLILEATATPHAFDVVGFRTWKSEMKPAMVPEFRGDFGKLPVLTSHEDGLEGDDGAPFAIGQESAITRFLARRCGLAPEPGSPLDARVDSLYTFYFCTLRNDGQTHEGAQYGPKALRAALSDASAAGASRLSRSTAPTYRETRRVNDLTPAQRSVAALGVFEEQLEISATGFLASSDAMTYVDLALFCELDELAEEDNVGPDFAERLELPRLGAFYERVARTPRVKRYLASPARMPRYERPGYVYLPSPCDREGGRAVAASA